MKQGCEEGELNSSRYDLIGIDVPGNDAITHELSDSPSVDDAFENDPERRIGDAVTNICIHPHKDGNREIPGYPGYVATESGEVYSRVRSKDGIGKRLSTFVDRDGYARVHVSVDGKKLVRGVHRLIALAFLGESPPDKPEVRHRDGDPSNNHRSNLSYGTHKDNMDDRTAHGRDPRGSRNGRAILNEDTVRLIKKRLTAGHRSAQIASDLGLNRRLVKGIATGKNWRHVA